MSNQKLLLQDADAMLVQVGALDQARALRKLVSAANAVVGARKEIFQIAAPETMWNKLDTLAEAVKR